MYFDGIKKMGSNAAPPQQPQHFCLRWNNHRSNLLTVFDELLQNEAFTDVTLACEGGSTKCHKMVLAACSSYFQELFTDLPYPCTHPVVVLKDVKYSEIKAILEYMYRGEVNVAQDQLAALLKVAEQLKVKGLIEENTNNNNNNNATNNKHNSVHSGNAASIKRDEPIDPQQSPPTISTSTTNVQSIAHSSSSNNGSPPHSSTGANGPQFFPKSQYSMFAKSPIDRSSRMGVPMWAVPGMSVPHHASTVTAQSSAPAMLSGCYEAAGQDMTSPIVKRKKMSSNIVMSRDTPILRQVLDQGQADSSQPVSLVCHPDSHENLHSNGSSYDNEKALKREPSTERHSQYLDNIQLADDAEDKMSMKMHSSSMTSPNYQNDIRGLSSSVVIATYVPTQKPEWKRYKQYTRNDIMSAIEAVRNGMSALKASQDYGVPSRTLYDKVKKLGIRTSRSFKRGSNGSNIGYGYPHMKSETNSPHGGHMYEGDENNSLSGTGLHHMQLDSSYMHYGHNMDSMSQRSGGATPNGPPSVHGSGPSPSTSPPSPSDHDHRRSRFDETNGSSSDPRDRDDDDHDDEDLVEDLSLRKEQRQEELMPQQSRVIMQTPTMNQISTIVKKELNEATSIKESMYDDLRRELQVDEPN